jgi:predicted PurR-regulated permease PerM
MTPESHPSAARETLADWVQTRAVLRIVFILLAVIAFLWIVYKLTPVLLLVVLSVFFAYLVAPLVDVVQQPVRIGGRDRALPRGLAIAVVYVVVFTGIGLAIYFLLPRFGAQFPVFKQQADTYFATIKKTAARLHSYFEQHGIVVNSDNKPLLDRGYDIVTAAFKGMLAWLIYLPWLVLIPILAFFFLKDADSFRRSALAMLPRGRLRWRGDELFQDINSALAAYIRAQLTACLIIGVVCSVGFALLGLPSPLVLGLIAGLLEFVPLVGPLAVAILAALLVLLQSGFGLAFVLLLFLGVLRIVQDYVIYPRLIGHGVHLHPLAVILAIMAGAELAGVAGIFLAIPVIAIVTVSYRHWLEHRGSETIAEVLQEAVVEADVEAVGDLDRPTISTTADEMARLRPDLLTGELKLPNKE